MTVHTSLSKSEAAVLPTTAPEGVLPAPASSAVRQKLNLRKLLLAGVAAVALVGASWYGYDYWTVGRFLVSTDDAYVKADNTTIAPKVSGYLDRVLVGDNEHVKAGQVLARIDDRDFTVALDQARADVAAANATVASKQAQLEVQQAVIAAAKATIDVDTAAKTFASQENKRYTDLAATGYGSLQNAQQAQARDAGADAAIQRDNANLTSALRQVDLLKAEIVQAKAAATRAAALQHQTELNLGYTTIVSPIDGVVGNRSLRVGQYVQAGTQLMAIVPAEGAYVVANFKETQLTNVRAGQTVEIEVDTFPGQIVHGHVDSIAPASGQEFALLPPDNATGNFTKVVQRIPVKIALDAETVPAIALRPGMSVIPSIATRSVPTAQAAATPETNIKAKIKAKRVSGGSCHVKQPLNLDASTRSTGRDV
ncbi:HlyD family secretion protein [Bradyrhizobium sp. CB1650]|uniref:HlyD family secretion protein n=1 Tax=Bradyrhizobium sp. CB1650 TaxID=3039153 RepID=UPI002435EFA6|nr:HlyD family secretion protein [Bradyrhizobium sp. CB1650]WGD53341.1 HlyD family secretion protein [Bradyrhizobium sp. CB1650]